MNNAATQTNGTNATKETQEVFAPTIKMHHATRGKAQRLSAILAAEYPRLSLHAIEGEELGRTDYQFACGGFKVIADNDVDVVIWESDAVPDLGDVLDAATEMEIDPEEGIDEEEDNRSAVVTQKYKDEYAARGNRDHCGDWLAGFLDGRFNDSEGRLDVNAFTQFLQANGVDMSGKWAGLPTSGQKGWVGRYRMNGRQKLELRVVTAGGVRLLDGAFVKAPVEYLEVLMERHPKATPEWDMAS